MVYSKEFEAFMAAERIINICESAGIPLTDPQGIAGGWYSDIMPEDMQYGSGASRLVIYDEDYCDFVIKIPLYESYEKYCQREVDVYKAAAAEGLGDKFGWCMCYSEPHYNEDHEYIPGIYVMEYVDCDEDCVYDSIWKYGYETYCSERGLDSSNYDAAEEYNSWNCGDDDDMVLDCIEGSMSEDIRKAFCIFMMKWNITDIHTVNVGFKGGNMVIIDYAGWGW